MSLESRGNKAVAGDRILQFDILRCVAMLAVIALHVAAQNWEISFPSANWTFSAIYDALVRWGVPVFFMISGALFLNLSRPLDVKRLYKKNVVRIVCAFLFWSALYALMNYHGVVSFFSDLIQGPVHFWFLKTLLGLYVVVPILRAVVSDRKTEEYFLIVAFLTTFIIPWLIALVGCVDLKTMYFLSGNYNLFRLTLATGYTGYFVLGHYLCTYPVSARVRHFVYGAAVVSFICGIMGTILLSHHLHRPDITFLNELGIFTGFESAAIFLFVMEKGTHVPERHVPLLLRVSNLSFGIYLVHVGVIRMLRKVIDISDFSSSYFIPLFAIVVFVVSYLIARLVQLIPGLNKYVM